MPELIPNSISGIGLFVISKVRIKVVGSSVGFEVTSFVGSPILRINMNIVRNQKRKELLVGSIVGSMVGSLVGSMDGSDVGLPVGSIVVVKVSLLSLLPSSVGSGVGLIVGSIVGSVESKNVGPSLEMCVGESVVANEICILENRKGLIGSHK